VNDAVGELIAEYAAETAERNSAAGVRQEVQAAEAALAAAESRVHRAQEYRGMQRARLRRALARLAALGVLVGCAAPTSVPLPDAPRVDSLRVAK